MAFFRTLLLFGLCAFVRSDDSIYDYVIDSVIQSFAVKAQEEGKDTAAIPDINHDINLKFPRISLANLQCQQGELGSLQSVYRIGHVSAIDDPPALHLTISIGLDALDVKFGMCSVKIPVFPRLKSPVEIRADNNQVNMSLTLTATNSNCTAKVDKIEIVKLGSITVDTKTPVFDVIDDFSLKLFHGQIVKLANKKITKIAEAAVQKVDLCSFMN